MNTIAVVRSFRATESARAMVHTAVHASGACASAVWSADGVAIAAASSAALVRHADADVVVVADAGLVDREALLCGLDLPQRASDAEAILHAYLKWGRHCAARLSGDFAFVVFDGRTGGFYAARDLMGVRPLYYSRGNDGVAAFATTLRGLRALPSTDTRIDERHLACYVLGQDDDRNSTFYTGIRRLPAGHWMECFGGSVNLHSYWSIEEVQSVRLPGDAEYAEAFRSHFLTAVRERLPSGGAASALSGGLDSSSIVCAARQAYDWQPNLMHAVSLVFPSFDEGDLRRIDERSYIHSVTDAGGLRSHHVRGDELSPLGSVTRIVDLLDEPFAAPNLYLHDAMYSATASAGMGVFLDGFDGDSVVGHGLNRLDQLLEAGAYADYRDEVRRFAAHRNIAPAAVVQHYGLPYLRSLARTGRFVQWVLLAGRLHRDFGLSRRELYRRHGPGRTRTGQTAAMRLLHPGLADVAAADGARADGAVQNGLMRPVFQTTLELAARTARSHGVEPSYPFFDRRLIEFCAGLPPEQKFNDGWTRVVMRRAMEGILPHAIQWRAAKSNLTPAFVRGLREDDVQRIRDVDFAQLADFVRVDELEQMRRDALSGGWEQVDLFLLFRMINLTVWFAARTERVRATSRVVANANVDPTWQSTFAVA